MKKVIAPALIGPTLLVTSTKADTLSEATQGLTPTKEFQSIMYDNREIVTDNQAINDLDLEPIIVGLTLKEEGPGWSIEKADRVAQKYKAYLYLVNKYPRNKIIPSKEVDEFWHAHILDTYKYMEDCQAIFGQYFHHYPYYGMKDENDKADLENSFQGTYELYLKEFPANFSSEVIARNALCIGEERDLRTALCIGEERDLGAALCIGESSNALTLSMEDSFERTGSFNKRNRPRLNRKTMSIDFRG